MNDGRQSGTGKTVSWAATNTGRGAKGFQEEKGQREYAGEPIDNAKEKGERGTTSVRTGGKN